MSSDWQTSPLRWKRVWRFLVIPASFFNSLYGKSARRWRYATLVLRRGWFRCFRPVRLGTHRAIVATRSVCRVLDARKAMGGFHDITVGRIRKPTDVTRGKRRETLFAAATVTGVVALLMMLGWHTFTLFAGSATADEGTAHNTGDAVVEPDKQPPPKKTRADVTSSKQPTVAHGNSTKIRKNPFGKGVGAFGSPQTKPKNAEVSATRIVDSELSHPRQPAAKKQPPLRIDIEPVAGDRQPRVGTTKVVNQSTPHSETVLGLEVVRTSVSVPPPPQPDARFLVTSVSAATSAKTSTKQDNAGNRSPDEDGWLPVQTGETNPSVHTRHGRDSTGPSNSQHVLVTSTANANWSVVSSRLKLEIILPSRIVAGERVPIRIRLTNVGAATAEAVTLNIDLPRELTYHVGQRLSHSVGDLKPGQTHEARLTARAVQTGNATVSASATDGTTVVAEKNTRSIASGPVRSQRK